MEQERAHCVYIWFIWRRSSRTIRMKCHSTYHVYEALLLSTIAIKSINLPSLHTNTMLTIIGTDIANKWEFIQAEITHFPISFTILGHMLPCITLYCSSICNCICHQQQSTSTSAISTCNRWFPLPSYPLVAFTETKLLASSWSLHIVCGNERFRAIDRMTKQIQSNIV